MDALSTRERYLYILINNSDIAQKLDFLSKIYQLFETPQKVDYPI